MASEKTVNYTAEQTAALVEAYKAGETVEALAARLGRTVRSVVAKLSTEKVYVSKEAAKAGKRVTKADVLSVLAQKLGLEASKLESLEKANLDALASVATAVLALSAKVEFAEKAE